jgi:hypothetical protein
MINDGRGGALRPGKLRRYVFGRLARHAADGHLARIAAEEKLAAPF